MTRDRSCGAGELLRALPRPFGWRARRREAERRARVGRERAGRRAEWRTFRKLERLTRGGCYYVFSDLPTLRPGNVDHLVVGPGGLTVVEVKADRGTIEAVNTGRGAFSLRVDDRPLHRDLAKQIRAQISDVCERAGVRTGLGQTRGIDWLVCFPAGALGPTLPPEVRAHVATLDDLLAKLSRGGQDLDEDTVRSAASAVSALYARAPSARPEREPGESDQEGRREADAQG